MFTEWKDSEARVNLEKREANPGKVTEDEINVTCGMIGFRQKQGQIIAMGSVVPHYL